MYLIRVRAIINELISNQEFPATQYPFHKPDNRYGYKIPKSRNNKRPLKLAEIMEIFNYEPSTTTEQFARDIFVFSYLASGMNPIDIFKLKWSDIKNNQFTFVRKKTQNKTGGANKINVQLNEQLWDIINLHGRDRENSIYIFDVIPENASEKEIISHTRTAISSINPNLKKIAKKLNITEEISLYFARHSFSNNLMNSEVPIAFISKQLGHVDIKTTQNYLDSFTSENAFDYQKKLLDFSSIKKKN
jgi:integrase